MEQLKNNEFLLEILKEILGEKLGELAEELINKYFNFLKDKPEKEREAFLRVLISEVNSKA